MRNPSFEQDKCCYEDVTEAFPARSAATMSEDRAGDLSKSCDALLDLPWFVTSSVFTKFTCSNSENDQDVLFDASLLYSQDEI